MLRHGSVGGLFALLLGLSCSVVVSSQNDCTTGKTIWDILHNETSTIVKALYENPQTNLKATLSSPDANLTVFVPTDTAMTRYLWDEGTLAGENGSDTQPPVTTLRRVFEKGLLGLSYAVYNMVYGRHYFDNLVDEVLPLQTVFGKMLEDPAAATTGTPDGVPDYRMEIHKGHGQLPQPHCNWSQAIVTGDGGDPGCIIDTVEACNGVVHFFDGVALPVDHMRNSSWGTAPRVPSEYKPLTAEVINDLYQGETDPDVVLPQPLPCPNSIWQIIQNNSDTKMAASAVLASSSGLDTVLNSAGVNLTFFVPVNQYLNSTELGLLPVAGADASSTIANQSSAPPDSLLSMLLYQLVPGDVDMDAWDPPDSEGAPMDLPTLLSYFAIEPEGEKYYLHLVDQGPEGGFAIYGLAGNSVKNNPAEIRDQIDACNGRVYLVDGAMLPADPISEAPALKLSDNITEENVQSALEAFNVPYAENDTDYYAQLMPAAPKGPNSHTTEVAVFITVPVVVAVTLLVTGLVGLLVWRIKYRSRGGKGGKGGKDEVEEWLDNLENGSNSSPNGKGFPHDGSALGNLVQRNASLLFAFRARENAEARKMRETWEIDSADIELLKSADGERKRLGSGGFGEVYQGVWNGATPVAVKFICPHVSKEEHLKTLYKEISVLKDCRHNNIVQFYGAAVQENDVMLVTEYMPQGDLFHALQGPRSSYYRWTSRGKYIALDIARGLVYLHSSKIVHCDVKSPNILLGQSGNAKIGDMGMSRVLAKASVTKSASVGTWSWAAPELLLNSRINEQVDVYSFGIILWEIVTGNVPQRGCMRDFRVPEECSQDVADLYEQCIESEPHMRPSALEVAKELGRIILQEREEARLRGLRQLEGSVEVPIDEVLLPEFGTPDLGAAQAEAEAPQDASAPGENDGAAAAAKEDAGQAAATDAQPVRAPLKRVASINPFKAVLLARASKAAAAVQQQSATATPPPVDRSAAGSAAVVAGSAAVASGAAPHTHAGLNGEGKASSRFLAAIQRMSFKINPFKQAGHAAVTVAATAAAGAGAGPAEQHQSGHTILAAGLAALSVHSKLERLPESYSAEVTEAAASPSCVPQAAGGGCAADRCGDPADAEHASALEHATTCAAAGAAAASSPWQPHTIHSHGTSRGKVFDSASDTSMHQQQQSGDAPPPAARDHSQAPAAAADGDSARAAAPASGQLPTVGSSNLEYSPFSSDTRGSLDGPEPSGTPQADPGGTGGEEPSRSQDSASELTTARSPEQSSGAAGRRTASELAAAESPEGGGGPAGRHAGPRPPVERKGGAACSLMHAVTSSTELTNPFAAAASISSGAEPLSPAGSAHGDSLPADLPTAAAPHTRPTAAHDAGGHAVQPGELQPRWAGTHGAAALKAAVSESQAENRQQAARHVALVGAALLGLGDRHNSGALAAQCEEGGGRGQGEKPWRRVLVQRSLSLPSIPVPSILYSSSEDE